jgi:60 kDa SS-A/Ro ribonucleoprotein
MFDVVSPAMVCVAGNHGVIRVRRGICNGTLVTRTADGRRKVRRVGEIMSRLEDHAQVKRPGESATGRLSAELQLRSIVRTRLINKQARADEVADRVAELVPQVHARKVAALAVEAREQMKLRQAPLLLVREMARHKSHRGLVADTLARVMRKPDDLLDFLAIYWKAGRVPLSSQVKKGLAAAFQRFDECELAKCDRRRRIKLRDVLFLSHAKPRDEAQAAVWRRLIWGRLTTSHTSMPVATAGEDGEQSSD